MQLLALNSNFEPIRYMPFINLQWDRRYYSAGTFSLQILADDYDSNIAYFYSAERPEVAMVQKATLTETIQGHFIQLDGQFLEAKLNDKIVYPTYYGNGEIGATLSDMVNSYKRDIPLLQIGDNQVKGNTISFQETGGKLADVLYKNLETQEMSMRCQYDYQRNTIIFYIWQGVDRTQDQTENSYVVFSDGFKNLTEITASVDDSNYKNYAVVAGSGKGEERIYASVDLSSGEYKKQVFIDARSLEYDDTKQTLEEYKQSLIQKGLTKLLDYQTVINIEVSTSDNGFVYLQDYDLGDKVDVIIEDLQLAMTARIIAIHEVWKKNEHIVSLELGNKKLDILTKARLK